MEAVISNKSNNEPYRSGYVALIGRPNAGKSTLLNRLVGEKIAAVSNKPQTTRHRIQGVITRDEGQIVLVDTPGVDVLLLIRDASVSTGNGDRFVLDLVKESGKPALLLLNKTDKLADRRKLLPLMQWYGEEHQWSAVVPISALKGEMVDVLLKEIINYLPEGEAIFDADELTDQPLRSLVAEIVREKILQAMGQELPYVTAVVTEKFEEVREDFTRIYCAIFVERASQKKIIIGHGAEQLKDIGTRARRDIEHLLGHRCHLELFVKVEAGWRDKTNLLDSLGISE